VMLIALPRENKSNYAGSNSSVIPLQPKRWNRFWKRPHSNCCLLWRWRGASEIAHAVSPDSPIETNISRLNSRCFVTHYCQGEAVFVDSLGATDPRLCSLKLGLANSTMSDMRSAASFQACRDG
jgi:hypothetical protein